MEAGHSGLFELAYHTSAQDDREVQLKVVALLNKRQNVRKCVTLHRHICPRRNNSRRRIPDVSGTKDEFRRPGSLDTNLESICVSTVGGLMVKNMS